MDASNRRRAVIGGLLILIGSIFLLDNLGFEIDIPWYIFKWPMILIIIGIINLLSGNPRPAFIFFALGALFYLQIFDVLNFRDFWPIVLIIIGLAFIFRGRRNIKDNENDVDYIDEVAIFGGTGKKFTSQNLQGGKISCVFGGSEIDLRGSKLQEGATIDVFCMFGGAEIKVPEDWQVNLDATAVFGGFSDERRNISTEPTATLRIKGFVMFGGGELKS